jgi:hypothetical protein
MNMMLVILIIIVIKLPAGRHCPHESGKPLKASNYIIFIIIIIIIIIIIFIIITIPRARGGCEGRCLAGGK